MDQPSPALLYLYLDSGQTVKIPVPLENGRLIMDGMNRDEEFQFTGDQVWVRKGAVTAAVLHSSASTLPPEDQSALSASQFMRGQMTDRDGDEWKTGGTEEDD